MKHMAGLDVMLMHHTGVQLMELVSQLAPWLLGGGGVAALVGGFVFRNVLFGGNIKLIMYAVIALAIAGAVAYHFIQVANLRSAISAGEAQIASLQSDKEKLVLSNQSLEAANATMRETGRQMLQELSNLRAADATARTELQSALARLRDADRRTQLERLRAGSGVERLVNTVNRSSRCEIENFGRVGECRNGVFVPR